MSRFYLPPKSKNSDDVREALRNAYDDAEAEYVHKSIAWAFAHWYIAGVRDFRAGSFIKGMPSVPTRDTRQRRRVRCENSLVQAQTEMGRLIGIDLGPSVKRRPGLGLDNIREDALSQAVLDDCEPSMLTSQTKVAQAYHLVTYGTVGIITEPPDPALRTWKPRASLVPAWELRPLPGQVSSPEQAGGLSWCRWVNLDWFKNKFRNVVKVPRDIDDQTTQVESTEYGRGRDEAGAPNVVLPILGGIGAYSTMGFTRYQSLNEEPSDAQKTRLCQLREHWLTSGDGRVTRYVLQIGDTKPLLDLDYTSDEWLTKLGGVLPCLPLNIARYYYVGSWWARSFVDKQIPLNREMETLLGEWLDYLLTLSQLTALCMPSTMGIGKRQLDEIRKNKALFYTPDGAAPNLEPKVISPPNVGDAMGRTVGMLNQLQKEQSAQGELIYGGVPGRLESARATAMVGQFQNVPIAGPAESLAGAWVDTWRAALGFVRYQSDVLASQINVEVRRIDEMSVGLKFDPKSGRVALGEFAFPDPYAVQLSIRSKEPRDPRTSKEEILQYRQVGLMTANECLIQLVREGIDSPRLDRTPYNNYVCAWTENATFFQGGTVVGNEHAENHTIHLLVHLEFAQSLTFKAMKDQEQRVVLQHIDWHKSQLASLPDPVPGMDNADNWGSGGPPGLRAQMGAPPGAGMDTGQGTVPYRPLA